MLLFAGVSSTPTRRRQELITNERTSRPGPPAQVCQSDDRINGLIAELGAQKNALNPDLELIDHLMAATTQRHR